MLDWFKKIFGGKSGAGNIKNNIGIPGYYSSYPTSSRFSTSGGAKWPYGLSASGRIRLLDHFTLRQNARDAFHDTPQASAIVDRYADNVAHVGLKLECTPKITVLGITLEQAEEWAHSVEESFDLWAKSKKQHRAENMNWYQAHRLYQVFQHRDNDIFIRLFYSKDSNLVNPLQFEFIDPDQIRGDAFTSTAGPVNQGFGDGIVRDERGREKSYKLWLFDHKNNYEMLEVPRIGARSGRIMMLHCFTLEYAMQGRGYTKLSRVLQEFENLTDFSLSHVKNAIAQSTFPLYVKPSKEQPASNPFTGYLTGRGVSPINSETKQAVVDEGGVPLDYCPMPEATFETPGSVGVFNLKEGEELEMLKASTPSQNYDSFVSSFTSSLAASMSMPLEVLLMKFNANYSASRAALLMFWNVAKIWKAEMEADCLNPVYEMWLREEIAAGRISAPGWSDPRMRAAWLNCNWIGVPMPNIDPQKTAKADKTYVEMGAQTLSKVAKDHNGSDAKANRAKLKRELSELPEPYWTKKKSEGDK